MYTDAMASIDSELDPDSVLSLKTRVATAALSAGDPTWVPKVRSDDLDCSKTASDVTKLHGIEILCLCAEAADPSTAAAETLEFIVRRRVERHKTDGLAEWIDTIPSPAVRTVLDLAAADQLLNKPGIRWESQWTLQ